MDRPDPLAEPRHVPIRVRVALAMVLLVAFALLTAGLIVFTVESRAIVARVDGYLERAKSEFRVLATEGVDPATGRRFDGPSPLLRTYLERSVVAPDEGELGVVEGEVRWLSSDDVNFRPEEDPELLAHVLPLTEGAEMVVGTVRTPVREYRYLVAPVKFADSSGALVQVHDLAGARSSLMRTAWVYAVVSLGATALAAALAWGLVGRLLRPVEDLRIATDGIDEHDLTTRVPVRGNDDLTRLATTINRMLDRVEGAVEGQRQLLDDVGHELRTPLTIVRGHLELIDPADPSDVKFTRDLALDEVDRMGGLVNDLLVLAKANQSDFITREWVSLATLTDQTLEKARALGEREWRLRRIESAEAYLDPGRIAQAWLQLAANAVKYSGPASIITIACQLDRGEVRLSIGDEGIGIPPDELERVRQRFGRGRAAVGHEGAGLGLSIVESIVQAHDGRLEIDSEPGVGSTFTIVVPLAPAGEGRDTARGEP